MSINMKSLLPETYRGLERLCSDLGWADIHAYMEPEIVAWLTFRLAETDDIEDYFPHGKWATIQRLQDLVSTAAREQEPPADEPEEEK